MCCPSHSGGHRLDCVGMTSSDSSMSIMFVSFVRLGGTSPENLEASTSVASSRALSPVDAKALQDLQVIKLCHDFDSAVSEGSLAAIRERYSILGSMRYMLNCSSNNLIARALPS
ncbi:hypothetical protein GW17_00014712 [Ensete ventricosum]|nr:hypothetical protein GW17_00014712 [Ensete ventricosum]